MNKSWKWKIMQRRRKRFLKSRIALKKIGLLLQLSHELKMCWIAFSHSACTWRCARKAAKRCCLNNELWWPLSMLGESPDEKLKFRRTMAAMMGSQSPKANFNQSQLTRNFSYCSRSFAHQSRQFFPSREKRFAEKFNKLSRLHPIFHFATRLKSMMSREMCKAKR